MTASPVQIVGFDFLVLVKTRSNRSYINQEVVKLCRGNIQFCDVARVQMADGSPVTMKRKATLGLILDGVWGKESFIDLPEMIANVLLGMDVLHKRGVILDLSTHRIYSPPFVSADISTVATISLPGPERD